MGNLDMVGGKTVLANSAGSQLVQNASQDGEAETLALFAGLFALMQQTRIPNDAEAGTGQVGPAQTGQAGTPAIGDAVPRAMPQSGKTGLPASALLMAGTPPEILAGGEMSGKDAQDDSAARLTRLLVAAGNLVESPALPTTDGPDAGLPTGEGMSGRPAVTDMAAGQPAVTADLAEIPSAAAILLNKAANLLEKVEVNPGEAALDGSGLGVSGLGDAATKTQHHPAGRYGANVSHLAELMSAIRSSLTPAAAESHAGMATALKDDGAPKQAFILSAHADFVGPMPQVTAAEGTSEGAGLVTIAPPSVHFSGPMPVVADATMRRAAGNAATAPSSGFVGPMPVASATPMPQGPLPAAFQSQVALPESTLPPAHTPGPNANHALPAQSGAIPSVSSDGGADILSGDPHVESSKMPVKSRDVASDLKAESDQLTAMAAKKQFGPKMAADLAQQTKPTLSRAEIDRLIGNVAVPKSSGDHAGSGPSANAATGGAQLAIGGSVSSGGGNASGGNGGGQQAMADAGDALASRDNAGKVMVHRLNTDLRGWGGTLVRQLETGMQSGTQALRIILEPGNLGKLNVDLYFRDGGAAIRMAAETAEAARLLNGSRHHLSQMLEGAGMRLASLQTVTNGGGETGADTQNNGDGSGQQENTGKNGGGNQSFANKMRDAGAPGDAKDMAADDAIGDDTHPQGQETAVLSILA